MWPQQLLGLVWSWSNSLFSLLSSKTDYSHIMVAWNTFFIFDLSFEVHVYLHMETYEANGWCFGASHVLLSRFYPDFIQILNKITLSKVYPDFILIFVEILIESGWNMDKNGKNNLSIFYPHFCRNLDRIWMKYG